MIVVNANSTVNGTVTAPQNSCFDASNILTVAGGDNTFVVEIGASAVMIAGLKISFLPGATVQPGGYLHGYITTTNGYCGNITPPVMAVATGEADQVPLSSDATGLSIYPNPTTGRFTLVQKDGPSTGRDIKVSICGMHGELYLSKIYRGEPAHEFDLSGLKTGMYFLKVINGDKVAGFKVILTR
jgi:hypothetical protein